MSPCDDGRGSCVFDPKSIKRERRYIRVACLVLSRLREKHMPTVVSFTQLR